MSEWYALFWLVVTLIFALLFVFLLRILNRIASSLERFELATWKLMNPYDGDDECEWDAITFGVHDDGVPISSVPTVIDEDEFEAEGGISISVGREPLADVSHYEGKDPENFWKPKPEDKWKKSTYDPTC